MSGSRKIWADFEENIQDWQTPAPASLELSTSHLRQGKYSLKVNTAKQTSLTLSFKKWEDWSEWDNLEGEIYLPEKHVRAVSCYLLISDAEHFWYRLEEPALLVSGWNLIRFPLDPSSPWTSLNHQRPWSRQVATSIIQVSLYFQSAEALPPFFHLDYFRLTRKQKQESNLYLYDFIPGTRIVPQYSLWQASFLLSKVYRNPFDPGCIDITATFITPAGQRIIIPAFYTQEYCRSLIDGKEQLTPVGDDRWMVRFTPTVSGVYRYFFTVNDGKKKTFPGGWFRCIPSRQKGFVRVSKKDSRFFEYDDGSFYYPIGLNIISPWDTPYGVRYLPTMPVGQETYAYDAYFKKMEENGLNFIRMWMAYWWLELEWNLEKGPFQGLGRYSLANAWRLDHIINQAEKKNIKILLTINNHTRLTSWGWPDNPYNIASGGFLRHPWEMFTDEMAKEFFRRRMRYIVARWSYSPAIFAWDLWSEIDLTGGYQAERIRNWHREMATYIRKIDPWKHLISTHYCQHPRAHDLAGLPEMDFIHSNAWVNVAGLSDSQVEAIAQYYRDFARYQKPVLISEYGGHWAGTQLEIMTRDLHTGLWANCMNPLAGTPLFWWWNLVHQDDLYYHYRGLSNFLREEDYRGKNLQAKTVEVLPPLSCFGAQCLSGQQECFLWVYNFSSALRLVEEKREIKDACLKISDLKPGCYRIEWWDTKEGKILQTTETTATETGLVISIPSFFEDLAAKVKWCHE